MSDISSQLIKDSYNYILQSDLSTGVVYRIGGGIPVNPIFLSGLTIISSFKFSNGSEQAGYVLISDSFGNATWVENPSGPSGNYLYLSGGTVTGPTIFTSGLTANTISATTYFNLPKDVFVTGGTYNNGTVTFTNNSGGTFNVSGFSTSTGTSFTGGTVSGATNFTDGLSANTISATTYLNLPLTSLSGLSDVSITSVSSGDTLVYSGSSWVNAPLSEITGEYNVKITTPSSIVSGTTSETQVLKVEIPPYSFAANDVLNIPTLIISKVGTGASYSLRVKLSELSTMPVGTGTQTIAFMSIGNTNIFTKLSRNFIINGGFLKGYPLSNNATDVTNSTVSLREQAFDHTITNYLYVSVTPAFAGDTFQLIGLQINNL